jgi:hypothetical protein
MRTSVGLGLDSDQGQLLSGVEIACNELKAFSEEILRDGAGDYPHRITFPSTA